MVRGLCAKFLAKHPGAYFRGSCDKLLEHVYCMLIAMFFALLRWYFLAIFCSSISCGLSVVVAVCRDDKSNSFRSWLTWRMRNVSQLKLMGTACHGMTCLPAYLALISVHNEHWDGVASMPRNWSAIQSFFMAISMPRSSESQSKTCAS